MDTLFLVGDLIDIRSMKKTMFWPQSHNNVLRTILGKAKRGTKVIFVPGNHDDVLREFDGAVFGNLEVHREYIHEGAAGRRILVLHGDEFDSAVRRSTWLSRFGGSLYEVLSAANPLIGRARRRLDPPLWSLPFEEAVATAARKRGVDTVVCGHVHHAEIRDIDGILYCNDGDWVESCTSVVEDLNGQLRLIDWPRLREQIEIPVTLPAGRAA
jgi:UDP-2,3-diacylglucosamine pyrophosphatase LpxH